MKNATLLTLSCLLTVLLAPGSSRCEEFLLYAPQPAVGDQVPRSPQEGVLVRKITIKRGDTLIDLSRKHIGVGSWFPQVLLFNKIKNPDLIHTGESLLVPVPPARAALLKKSKAKKRQPAAKRQAVSRKPAADVYESKTAPVANAEQESYQRAKRAYLTGDYQKAADLFDRFLRRFPDSSLAADASLYRADSFMRLSGE